MDAARIAVEQALSREVSRGPILKGSMKEIYRTCGKASCKCSSGEKKDRHGPYVQYCFWEGKKLRAEIVSGGREHQVREALARNNRVRRLRRALMVLARARVLGHDLHEIAGRWPADGRYVRKILGELGVKTRRGGRG
jgi:hypothetical protein